VKYLTLPLDIGVIENFNQEDIMIDMSDLQFPCKPELKIRSAFIFIRNVDLNMNLDFSKCSFKMKEEFLLMYLTGNIGVNIPCIRDTWIDILLYRYNKDNLLIGIMDSKEIEKFSLKHNDLITEVYTLIASLPVMVIYQYSKSPATYAELIKFDGEFEESDYDKINFSNFSRLTESRRFGGVMIDVDKYPQKFYKHYFAGNDQISMARLNENLPLMNLLNIFFSPKDTQERFISGLNDLLTTEEVSENNE